MQGVRERDLPCLLCLAPNSIAMLFQRHNFNHHSCHSPKCIPHLSPQRIPNHRPKPIPYHSPNRSLKHTPCCNPHHCPIHNPRNPSCISQCKSPSACHSTVAPSPPTKAQVTLSVGLAVTAQVSPFPTPSTQLALRLPVKHSTPLPATFAVTSTHQHASADNTLTDRCPATSTQCSAKSTCQAASTQCSATAV